MQGGFIRWTRVVGAERLLNLVDVRLTALCQHADQAGCAASIDQREIFILRGGGQLCLQFVRAGLTNLPCMNGRVFHRGLEHATFAVSKLTDRRRNVILHPLGRLVPAV